MNMIKESHDKQITDKDAHLNMILEDKDTLKKEKDHLLDYVEQL